MVDIHRASQLFDGAVRHLGFGYLSGQTSPANLFALGRALQYRGIGAAGALRFGIDKEYPSVNPRPAAECAALLDLNAPNVALSGLQHIA